MSTAVLSLVRQCIRELILLSETASQKDALLIESIIDSLKERYADQGIDVDEIASYDPSSTKKYTPWMVKQLVVGANPNDVYPSIAFFHRHVAKFERRDINAYRTAGDLEDAVKAVDTKLGSAGGETSAKIIAEDGPLTLEWLETKQDAWRYTNSSHWCITQRSACYFDQYTSANTVFYVIRDRSKDPKSMDDGFAYAISVQRDSNNEPGTTDVWRQTDETIDPKELSDVHRRFVALAVEDARERQKSVLARLNDDRKNGTSTVSDEEIERTLKLYKTPEEMQMVVGYLPSRFLVRYIDNENNDVRYNVAHVIDPEYLPRMLDDEDKSVRHLAVMRVDPSHLPQMLDDEYYVIRYEVASRIDLSHLPKMLDDESSLVRCKVAERIALEHLPRMMDDRCDEVRARVAQRIAPEYLQQMVDDESVVVRYEVIRRNDALAVKDRTDKQIIATAHTIRDCTPGDGITRADVHGLADCGRWIIMCWKRCWSRANKLWSASAGKGEEGKGEEEETLEDRVRKIINGEEFTEMMTMSDGDIAVLCRAMRSRGTPDDVAVTFIYDILRRQASNDPNVPAAHGAPSFDEVFEDVRAQYVDTAIHEAAHVVTAELIELGRRALGIDIDLPDAL